MLTCIDDELRGAGIVEGSYDGCGLGHVGSRTDDVEHLAAHQVSTPSPWPIWSLGRAYRETVRLLSLPWLVGAAAVRALSDPDRIRLVLRQGRVDRSTSVAERIDLAVAGDELSAAQSLLATVPLDDPGFDSLTAAVLLAAGEVSAAEAAAVRARTRGRWSSRRRAARVLRRARVLREELGTAGPSPAGARADESVVHRRSTPGATRPSGESTPPRVLHVVKNSLPYVSAGYTLRTQAILRAQADDGMDVRAVTRLGFPVAQGRMANRVDVVEGVTYHRLLGVTGTNQPAYARRLTELARGQRASVLHAATDHVNGSAARFASAVLGIPFFYEVRGFLEDSWASRHGGDARAQLTERYRWSRARETDVMLAADGIFTLSQTMATEIIQRGVDAKRIWVVPNAVDDAYLRPLRDARKAKEQMGLPVTRVWVGAITTLYSFEGIATLLTAVRLARANGLDVGAVVVGDGPARFELERMTPDDGSIRWIGRVPRRRTMDWYDALDAIVIPRDDHKVTRLVTPLKPVEALARGKLVIASDLPALREASGGFARFVAAGDAEALAREFALIEDNRQSGLAGRAWVDNERRWSRVCAAYRAAYASVGVG